MANSHGVTLSINSKKMSNEFVTIDSILKWFVEQVENKNPVPAEIWLDASSKLNLLSEDIDDQIAEQEGKIAELKVGFVEAGDSVAKAVLKVESKPEYIELSKLKAKRERIQEHIRITKLRSREERWHG